MEETESGTINVRLSRRDILRNIHAQPKCDGQRIPYPIAAIIEKAGIDFESVESINASAIKASERYHLFALRFDEHEMRRVDKEWLRGGWLINIGPGQDKSLGCLEFLVDTSRIHLKDYEPKEEESGACVN